MFKTTFRKRYPRLFKTRFYRVQNEMGKFSMQKYQHGSTVQNQNKNKILL